MAVKKALAFAQLFKIDEAKREAWGIATEEIPDASMEMLDYESSKPYFEQWSAHAAEVTDGQSLGNLRYMHQLDAVGKLIAIEFDDVGKKVIIGVKIVDDSVWEKTVQRVLTGFSIGGRYIKTWKDKTNKAVTRFTASISEISIVDLPAVSTAVIDFTRADGSTEQLHFAPSVTKAGKTKRVAGEDLTASDFIIVGDKDDTSTWKLPYKFSSNAKTKRHLRNALARFNQMTGLSADEKKKAWSKLKRLCSEYGIDVGEESKAVITELEKSMYSVASLSSVLQDIKYLESSCMYEGEYEDDERDFAIADSLRSWLADGFQILREMVDEEGSELTASKAASQTRSKSMNWDELQKRAVGLAGHFKKAAAFHEKAAGEHEDMASEHEKLHEVHKSAMASCGKAEDGESDMKPVHKAHAMHHKAMAANHSKMAKAHGARAEQCMKMGDEYEEAAKMASAEIEKAKGAPAPVTAPEPLTAESIAKAVAAALKPADPAAVVPPPAVVPPATTDLTKAVADAIAAVDIKKMIEDAVKAQVAAAPAAAPMHFSLVPRGAAVVKAANGAPATDPAAAPPVEISLGEDATGF